MNDKRKEIVYQLPTPDKLHTLRTINRLPGDNHNQNTSNIVSKRFSNIVEHHVYVKDTNESIIYRTNNRDTNESHIESQIKFNKYSPKKMKTFCQTSIPHCSKDKYFISPRLEFTTLDNDQFTRVRSIKKTDEPSIVEHCDSTTDLCNIKHLRVTKEISPEPKISTTLNNNERLYVVDTNKNFDNSTYKSSESDKVNSIYVVETEKSIIHGDMISTPLCKYYLNPYSLLKLNQESQEFSRRNVDRSEYHNITSHKKPLSEISGEIYKTVSIESSLDVSPCESTLREIKSPNEKVAMWKVDFDNAQNNDYVDFCEADCVRVNERIINEKRILLNKLRQSGLSTNLNSENNASCSNKKDIYKFINISTKENSNSQTDTDNTSSADKSEIVISSDSTSYEQDECIENDGDLYEIAPGMVVRLPKADNEKCAILSPEDTEIMPKLERCKQIIQKNVYTSPLSSKNIANISGSKLSPRKESVLNSIGNYDITDVRYSIIKETSLSPNNKYTAVTTILPKNTLTKTELRFQVPNDIQNLSLKNNKTNNYIIPLKTHADKQISKESNYHDVFNNCHNTIDVISISSGSSLKDYADNINHSTPKANIMKSKSSERSKTIKTPVKLISDMNNITEKLRSPVKVLFDTKMSPSDKKINRSVSTQKGFDKKRNVSYRNSKKKQNDVEPPSPETTERNEFYSYLQIITKPLRKDGTPIIKNRRSVRVRNLEINKQRDSEVYNIKGTKKVSADKRDRFKKSFVRKKSDTIMKKINRE